MNNLSGQQYIEEIHTQVGQTDSNVGLCGLCCAIVKRKLERREAGRDVQHAGGVSGGPLTSGQNK